MRNVISAITALGLVALPVAASAGTRASDVVPAAAKVDRASPEAGKKKKKMGEAGVGGIIAGGTVLGTILIVSQEDDAPLTDG
jgi:hypothetical protein